MSDAIGAKILVVDDEPMVVRGIERTLLREGFRVVECPDGLRAVQVALAENPALIILDITLPGANGYEVCQRLRADPLTRPIPILMLTAHQEELDAVRGFAVGADDFVRKPFGPAELIARIKALFRRGGREPSPARSTISRGGLVLDPQGHQLSLDGVPVALTATEFRLLHVLASNPGRALTRPELLSRAISENVNVIDRNVDVHVRSLRKKLGPYHGLIETVRGLGYRFAAE